MSEPLSVDTKAMAETAAELRSLYAQYGRALDELDQTVRELSKIWQGAAADKFQQMARLWHENSSEQRQVLGQLAERLSEQGIRFEQVEMAAIDALSQVDMGAADSATVTSDRA